MKKINSLSDINTKTAEGRLLMASLVKLTTENHTDKTPDEVIGILNKLVKETRMFEKD